MNFVNNRKEVVEIRRLILLSFIVFLVLSCSDENPLNTGNGTGTALIDCLIEHAKVAKVTELMPTTSAEISFYDSKNTLLVNKTLTVSGKRISGNVTVKAGSGYRTELFCYDRENRVTHSGTASDVSIVAGKETKITILLKPALPEAPSLSSLESSVLTDSTYVLSWAEVSRAKSYTIEEAADSSFTDPVSKTIVGTSESFTKTTDTEHTYYYRIRANNPTGSSGWSNVVSVTIEPQQHALILDVDPSGSGTTDPPAGSYAYNENTVVTLRAIPEQGYRFANWSGDVSDASNDTTTVTMTSEKHVTAHFEEIQEPQAEITMVSIPGGSFQMGSEDGESDEQPVHTVTLDTFEMSTYEITQGQYTSVIGTNPSHFTGDDNVPVETISWYDAVKFCNLLSDDEGFERCYDESTWECDFSKNGYRLPTEAEWEYACRAGTTSKYYSGDDEIGLNKAGWYNDNSDGNTHPAGLKDTNDWGLYDMHGNVWELCNDWYDENYYGESPAKNPTGPATGTERVMRGGSWGAQLSYNRSAYRHHFPITPSDMNEYVGFRIVRGSFTPGYTISGTVTGADGVMVTLSGDGSDSQTVNDGGRYSFAIEHGSSYTLMPSLTGYNFSPTSQTFSNVTANQTQDFTASKTQYTLTMAVNQSGWGATTPSAGSYTYDEDTVVTVTATPTEGYRFVNWTGGVADADSASTSVTMAGNITVTANFEEIPGTIKEITMVSIPAGNFQMGDIQGGGENYERPVHEVTVNGFEMSKYEITQGQYKSVLGGSNPSDFRENDDLPVEQVNWYDAVTFCNMLSEQEGFEKCYNESTWECDFSKNGYRLPTEAEWEYACRAGTETKFYTGNAMSSDGFTSTDLDRAGWYDGNSEENTHAAGQKEPNEFGLYDMHGNVWEWCNDWFAEDYYSSSPSTNPTGPVSGSYRVFRGGSWYDFARNCRSANRARTSPSAWFWNIGFRVVRGAFTPGPTTYTLTLAVNQSGWGTTTPSVGIHTYDEDTAVTVTATPAEGYRFVNWTGNVTDAGSATTKVIMSGNKTITANFEEIQEPVTEITMVSIPAGSFDMGDIQGGGDSDERPVHDVTLNGFEMSIYTITQGLYKFVIGSNPSGFTGDDNLPVEQVSWYDAVRFCNSMSDKAGFDRCYDENTWECDFSKNGFRLPTEAEWEYACRAGTTTKYNTGDSESDLARAGWYSGNSSSKTHPVGRKEPNALGLYDMHGNVYEWCHDWYDSEYYAESPANNPTGAQSGSSCVIRGGDWYSVAGSCRSASRTFKLPDGKDRALGFRVVRGAFTPTPITYTISGKISGTDGVTITLSGDKSESMAVNDGSTYSFTVDEGGNYTVTPSKDGYKFSPASISFSNIDGNKTQNFSAIKLIRQYNLTMAVNNSTWGTTSPSPGSQTYDEDTVVPVTATPAEGYRFVNWSGDVANADSASTEVTITGDITVTANFEEIPPDQYTLTMVVNQSDWGSTTPSVGSHTYYDEDTVVPVTATPAEGYRFVNWSGDVANADSASTEVTITGDITVTANFEEIPPEQYTLTMAVNQTDWGTTTPVVGSHTYDEDTIVPVTATPADGYRFVNWTGDVAETDSASTSVTISGDITVTAHFEEIPPEQYTLTMAVNHSGWGTTTPYVGSHEYDEGTVVNIGAIPVEGYRFVSWTGDVADANTDSTSITMTEDKAVTANFEEIQEPAIEIMMVSITGGTFQMGSVEGDYYEKPVHTVTLTSFEMSAYEITQGQYKEVIGTNPSYFSGSDDLPVEIVSWYDAVKFCNALSGEAGLTPCYDESTWSSCNFSADGFRLPTEAEWEYACRAGTETNYNTGNNDSDLGSAGWYSGNSSSKTHTVGEKTPNAWGLYDMHGNVWEWCNDWYDNHYYDSSPTADPTGPSSGSSRVKRGGSFFDGAGDCRSANRAGVNAPGENWDLGFRVVRGTFTPSYTISGTITGAEGVTVTLGGDVSDSQTVNDGDSFSFTIVEGGNYTVTPSKSGYEFTPVSQTFSTVSSNQTQDFSAYEITPEQYTLTMAVNQTDWGTTTPSVGSHTYEEDTVVMITATPAEGYRFVNWTGSVADANSATTTVTMSADRTVTANFEEIKQEQTFFTLGSTMEEVRAVQGSPSNVEIWEFSNEIEWKYGYSTVTFSNDNKIVIGYDEQQSLGDDLKVYMGSEVSGATFSIGSTQEEVIKAQGTPNGVIVWEFSNEIEWKYGYSTVTFSNDNKIVIGYNEQQSLGDKLNVK